MDMGLTGKFALVTGGSSGIGLGVARALCQEKCNIIIVGRDISRLQKEAQNLKKDYSVEVSSIQADVSVAEDCDFILKEVSRLTDKLHIIINNAGTGSNEKILQSADEKWQYYWNLHVMAAVRLCRGLVPIMIRTGGGAIINNASICAVQPLWYEPIYNVTKAALMMLSKNLANELIAENIRVNTINPGLILTPDWINTAKNLSRETDSNWEKYLDSVAEENTTINRFGTIEELANFFVFLCSDKASYSVGSTYQVDGGMLKTLT